MQRAYYSSSIASFLAAEEDHILGQLMIEDPFQTEDLQKNTWRTEIRILKQQLASFSDGEIAFEFTIPRMGAVWMLCSSSRGLFSCWSSRQGSAHIRNRPKIR